MATGVAVPVALIVALALGGAGGGGKSTNPSETPTVLPPVTVSAPPSSASATVSTCAQVISALPLTLAGASLRRTVSNPPSPSIVAWGDPAIVLRCGVAKPKQLTPSLASQLFEINHSVLVLPHKIKGATVFTVVDRSVFLDVTVPSSYAQPPLGPIADAVAKALPTPVCTSDATAPRADQCTRRS